MKMNFIRTALCLHFAFTGIPILHGQTGEAQENRASQSELSQGGTQIRLEDLVKVALERNPELQAAGRNIDVMRSKISPAGTLPDPQLMIGQSNEGNIIPFTTLGNRDAGFSEIYLGLSQDLPFPGKLPLKRKVAEMEAKAEESRHKFTRLRIISEVKTAYYDLYAIYKSMEIVEKERTLLEQFEKIASARYSVGKGTQQDVLDAQVEVSRMEERLAILRQRKESAEALLNTLLFQPPTTILGRPVEIQKAPLSYNLTELGELSQRNFPLLESQQRLVDRDAFALDLAKREKYPDFGFTFIYHNRGSNRDYWTIGANVKLPLHFNRKQRYEIEGAISSLAQSRHAYENSRAQTLYRVKNAYLMATTADHLLQLYDQGILRQASFSLEAAVDNYQVGKIDFLTLLTSWTRLLNYELTYYEQIAEYQKALAQLEPLVGIELAK